MRPSSWRSLADICNELFKIEEKLRDLSAEDRRIQRLKLETPLLEAYWSWVDRNSGTVLAKSEIGQAFQYALNQKAGLMNYLEDGHCEISNNIAENNIRPFTVGRRYALKNIKEVTGSSPGARMEQLRAPSSTAWLKPPRLMD